MPIISLALLPKQDPRETWHEALTLDPASQSQLQVEQVGWWAQEPQLMTQVLDPLNLKASETVPRNCHGWPSVREGRVCERTIHLCPRRKGERMGFAGRQAEPSMPAKPFLVAQTPTSGESVCRKTLEKAPVSASVQ